MMLLAVVMLFSPFLRMLNVFKINITPARRAVKEKVEHVQYVVVSIIYGLRHDARRRRTSKQGRRHPDRSRSSGEGRISESDWQPEERCIPSQLASPTQWVP